MLFVPCCAGHNDAVCRLVRSTAIWAIRELDSLDSLDFYQRQTSPLCTWRTRRARRCKVSCLLFSAAFRAASTAVWCRQVSTATASSFVYSASSAFTPRRRTHLGMPSLSRPLQMSLLQLHLGYTSCTCAAPFIVCYPHRATRVLQQRLTRPH